MTESLFSPYWYLVSELKPKLSEQTEVHRHRYRGHLWYVLEDHVSSRHHRFSEAAYFVIGRLDGERTVQDIWNSANTQLGDEAPTQDEVIKLLGQLHTSDVLICDVAPDTAEMLRRHDRTVKAKLKQRLMSPLLMRFALFDPDALLGRVLPYLRPVFRWIPMIWLVVVGAAFSMAITHWPELSADISERVFAPHNLLILWIGFPLIKLLHELGHAIAVKAYGGEVHEMGVSLLVLTPVPYVDASAASAFPSKRSRIIVSAAGMIVELFVAAMAMFLWLNVEPGLLRDIAYVVMFIAGVSTVLFNANPLLKFDGYYMLSDAMEIPNLASRSYRYIGYLIQRYGFGVEDAVSPVTAHGEKTRFVAYAICAFLYRIVILLLIALYIASKFFFIGIALAVWVLCTQIALPLVKALGFLITSTQLRQHRPRTLISSTGMLAMLSAFVFLMPLPFWTRVEGIVWLPEQSLVRSGIAGTITEIVATPDMLVDYDQPLFISDDPFLKARIKILEANLAGAIARYQATVADNRVEAETLSQESDRILVELNQAREDAAQLIIRSPGNGSFVVPLGGDLIGRYVNKGDLIGYVGDRTNAIIRVVVLQSDISIVRESTEKIQVRFSGQPPKTLMATIEREVPAANTLLPNKALGTEGGGKILIDPLDKRGVTALQKVFQIELALTEPLEEVHFGKRVDVRFEHAASPLAAQLYRFGRQTFLRHFGV